MRCQCGSPDASYVKEIDGEIHFLCRNCAYHPDECEHPNIAASIAEPVTANTKTYMVGICESCLTVRELPSLTGDIQELFEKGRDIPDAIATQINGKWYISTSCSLPWVS
ncbi:hypothetical protein LCGC14_2259900 [marine sediment metagenome]|uniref:Uncharacterized protein n=1 Tax=marine sediment metagenome TaxID=412755 RepID=A0A0F9D003_9ZZZZ